MGSGAELAVVVLSYRNEQTIEAAIDSLTAQDVPVEIVVVHSGGGTVPERIRARHPGIPVIASSRRRQAGWARNEGVAATRAPYVSFLAADCRAAPGWAAARLRRHRAGAVAVASALVPDRPGAVSRAAWLAEHSSRLPRRLPGEGGLHGASYARWVLERHGPFREDLVVGEDTRLNDRLMAAGIAIEWAPDVRCEHRYPGDLRTLVADAWTRGARRAAGRGRKTGRRAVWRSALRSVPRALARCWDGEAGVSRPQLLAASPLVLAAAVSKAAGAAVGRYG